MSETHNDDSGSLQTPSVEWWFRWILAASLLFGGLLLLSTPWFGGSWWVTLKFHNNAFRLLIPGRFQVAALLVATLTATALLGWATVWEEARATVRRGRGRDGWPVWLLVYSTSVAVLSGVINGDAAAVLDERRILEITALVLLATASWCLATMPAGFWVNWISRNPKALLSGAAVGFSTYVLGRHYGLMLFGIVHSFEDSTLWLVFVLLHLFTRDIVFEPGGSIVGTKSFVARVTAGCTGLQGVTLFLTFFGVYLWIYRKELRFPSVLVLLPVGAAILYLLNVVRIVALILIGSWSHSLAVHGFHSVAGWLLFNIATLGIVITSRRSHLFTKTRDPVAAVSTPGAPYLVPLLLMIAIAMVSRIFVFSFDIVYPLRAIVGAGALWVYWRGLRVRWNVSWPAVGLGVVAFVVWIVLVGTTNGAARDAHIGDALRSLPIAAGLLWILLRVIGAVVVAPIAEELAFRGYLMRKFISFDFESVALTRFTWLSFLGSSILFGALHAQWVAGTLAGMIFAVAVYRRGSLSDGIVSHATANVLLAAYVLATGHWFLWD